MARTAAAVKPRSRAASLITTAATIPPVRGGRPAITYSLPAMGMAKNQQKTTIPKRPARAIKITFHCCMSCLMLMMVPMWVMQSMMTRIPPNGGPIPASSTMSLGKKVQYPTRNRAAMTKTDGIQALLLVPMNSPI